MKGIPVPAVEEDFAADPVELFFDLAYVIAFSQLVGVLVHEPTWAGVGKVSLLFALLWLPWQELTWSANTVSGNGRGVRATFLAATAVSVPMAASTATALDRGGPVFALGLAAIMVLGFVVQALSAERGTDLRTAVVRWIGPNVVAVAVLVTGAFVEGDGRVALWLVAVAIVLGAMVAAGRGSWLIRTGHFAERPALIVIIALGEVIVAIGLPVLQALQAAEGIPGRTAAALVASGVFAAALWWGYFDRVEPALEHRTEGIAATERGRFVRDVYTWGHAPIVLGVILSAAGLEQMTLHPTDPLGGAYRAILAGGLGLVVLGVVVGIWRAFRVVAKERVAAAVVVAVAFAVLGDLDGVVLLVLVDLVLLVGLAVEHRRIER